MRRSTMLSPVLAPLLASVLLLGACGDSDDDAKNGKESSSTPSDAAGSDEASDSGNAADDPAGKQSVAADASGITFAVDQGWKVIDPATVADKTDDPTVKAYAKSLDLEPSQLSQALAQVDVVAVGDEGDSVTVVKVPGFTEVPAKEELTSQVESSKIKVTASESVDTPLGKGTVLHYQLPDTAVIPFGTGVFVAHNGGVVNLTVTMNDADAADKLLADILPTLAPAA